MYNNNDNNHKSKHYGIIGYQHTFPGSAEHTSYHHWVAKNIRQGQTHQSLPGGAVRQTNHHQRTMAHIRQWQRLSSHSTWCQTISNITIHVMHLSTRQQYHLVFDRTGLSQTLVQ
jgi:hypothetical protein